MSRWLAAGMLVAGLAAAAAAAPADSTSADRTAAATVGAPPPPSGLEIADVPSDAGTALDLRWKPSPADTGAGQVRVYRIERAPSPGGPWAVVDSVPAGLTAWQDRTARPHRDYFYRVVASGPGGATPAASITGPVRAVPQWFHAGRAGVLVTLMLCFALLFGLIARAESGWRPFARRLAGVDAIEDAVRRAASAGRPVVFVPGTRDVDDLQTAAALDLLSRVAGACARTGAALRVPVAWPLTHALAEDVVRRAYEAEARADALDADTVRLLAPDPLASAGAIAGMLERERPAAQLVLGGLSAEALLLGETGARVGAFQVGGTADVAALPWLIATCDHTLIGPELFTAGASLSDEPSRHGSLRAVDVVILVLVAAVVAGCALETAGIHVVTALLAGGTP